MKHCGCMHCLNLTYKLRSSWKSHTQVWRQPSNFNSLTGWFYIKSLNWLRIWFKDLFCRVRKGETISSWFLGCQQIIRIINNVICFLLVMAACPQLWWEIYTNKEIWGSRFTCSGRSPGGTHVYSSKAHPESSSEVELLWNPSATLAPLEFMSGARVMGQIPDVVSRLIRWGHCSDNKKRW